MHVFSPPPLPSSALSSVIHTYTCTTCQGDRCACLHKIDETHNEMVLLQRCGDALRTLFLRKYFAPRLINISWTLTALCCVFATACTFTLLMLMFAVPRATAKPRLPVFSPRPDSVPHSEGKNSTLLHIDSSLCSRV